MNRRRLLIGAAAGSSVVAVAAFIGIAGGHDLLSGDEDAGCGSLVRAIRLANISLEQALAASEQEGRPISGLFEIDRGSLHLSVWTSKDGRLSEVLVDYANGNVAKVEPITRDEDLAAAESLSAIMAHAKTSLREAVGKTVADEAGFRAIGAVPKLKDGQVIAWVTLLKGKVFKIVNQPLE